MTKLASGLTPQAQTNRVSNAPPADSGLPGSSAVSVTEKAIIAKLDKLRASRDMDGFRRERKALIAQGHSDTLRRNGYLSRK